MATDPGMEDARELAGRVVPHHQPHVVAQLAQRSCLQLCMLHHRAPEGPRNGTTIPTFISARVYARLHNAPMQLEGVHHVTLITGDAPRNVDFYTRVLGLRLVKKTVNQDDPTVYHLFYADEKGSAGRTSPSSSIRRHPRQGRGRDGAHDRLAGQPGGGARLLGAAAASRGRERRAPARASRSRIPKAFGTSFASSRLRTSRSSRSTRRSRRSTRCRASTRSRLRGRSRAQQRPARGHARLRSPRRLHGRRGARRGGWYAYDTPPEGRAFPAPEPCTTSRGRRRSTITTTGRSGSPRPDTGRRP